MYCKRKSLDDSTIGIKKSKTLNEYVKEKGKKREGFFNLVKTTPKTLRKVASLQTYDPKFWYPKFWKKRSDNQKKKSFNHQSVKVIWTNWSCSCCFRKHGDHDQFSCGSDDYLLCYRDQKIYSLYQVVTRNSQSNFIKKN